MKIDPKDILKDVNPYVRRVIRRLVGFILSGVIIGVSNWAQEIILPDVQNLIGYETYQWLYTTYFVGWIAAIDLIGKKLREEGVYLPI